MPIFFLRDFRYFCYLQLAIDFLVSQSSDKSKQSFSWLSVSFHLSSELRASLTWNAATTISALCMDSKKRDRNSGRHIYETTSERNRVFGVALMSRTRTLRFVVFPSLLVFSLTGIAETIALFMRVRLKPLFSVAKAVYHLNGKYEIWK